MLKAYDWILFDQGGTLFAPLPRHYSEFNQRLAVAELGEPELARRSGLGDVFATARRTVDQQFLERPCYLHRELVAAHLLQALVALKLCDESALNVAQRSPALTAVVERYCDRQAQTVVANLRLRPDCHGALAALARHYSLGIVSNNAENYLQPLVVRYRLGQYLQAALTSDSLGACKPAPAIFAAAFAELGIDAERARVLYVGDSVAFDVAGARAAGLDVALLAPGGTHNVTASVVVRSLAELVNWLLQG